MKKEEAPKTPITREALSALSVFYPYFRPYLWHFVLGMFCLLMSTVTSLVFPYAIGKILDIALAQKGDDFLSAMYQLSFFMLAVLSAQAMFSFFKIVLFAKISENILSSVRQNLFQRIVRMPMNFFYQHRVGDLTSRLTADLSQIQDTFSVTFSELIRGIISLIAGIVVILMISVKLTLVMISTFPIVIIGAVIFGRFIRKLSKKVQDELAQTNTVAQETFQGILNVKTFTNEEFESLRYGNSIMKTVQFALKTSWYRAAFASFIIFCLFGSIILIVAFGASQVQNGNISVGDLTQFVIYTVFVGAALGGFSEHYAQIQKTIGATERVRELMSEPLEVYSHPNPQNPDIQGNIKFQNVKFAYPSRKEVQVLKNISFEMKAGEITAIVGPSGAGKSTISQLLLRLFDADSGEILIDGVKIQEIPLQHLRSAIAIVPQDVLLFGGTIKENILYGNLNATDAELEEAAKKANAHQFIKDFPEGYQTIVGERGVKLSGGQRQRIAIARALLKNPKILILDEATSSLDAESEKLVQDALNVLMENRTTLVIAHRLATIQAANQILVLNQGEIVEKGSHQDLVQIENGIYKKLAELQFRSEVEIK